ncbi:hypothetical protein ANOM_002251 [Aspergillus nomiae NRRL 13137]|uniref:ATP phosphoribosyltransferase n=1 Tax=Aspergillus nomiae NRRL (strain ATCC 15546 / NRRL 13137 / CBS 260.88 / M93) TaxID=1509407 RepID=A0A0L1JCN4_ASPN3|nr:uncharacterized protein ANOM_002251 [Aspergillus nomiae NRRL 13137]KNG89467.1 hypothetical protein ANOM_002251 [Aspergillus nomiae NRRL 13137]
MRPTIPSALILIGCRAVLRPLHNPIRCVRQLPATPVLHSSPRSTTAAKVTNYTYQRRTMSSASASGRYKLVFFVPHSHLEACKEAIFATGAGTFPGGKYTKCCFQMPGQGQFLPSDEANPAIGAAGALETVEEMKVEVMCFGRSIMLQAVDALIKAHPYEEVAYEVYKLEDV